MEGHLRMNGVKDQVNNRKGFVQMEQKLRTPSQEPVQGRKKPDSGGVNNYVGSYGRSGRKK